jgi:hypothetical protein
MDEQGNPRLSGGDEFGAHLEATDGRLLCEGRVEDWGDGSYTVAYEAQTAGEHHLFIYLIGSYVSDVLEVTAEMFWWPLTLRSW